VRTSIIVLIALHQ